jgi:hypothetical protein
MYYTPTTIETREKKQVMPTYPPRIEPSKKQVELKKREVELVFAIKNKLAVNKLIKYINKYRQARLSMLKAKVHQFKENEFKKNKPM